MTDIVIFGGAGYIGSHLVERLIDRGFEVTVVDDLSTGNVINQKSRFLKYDVRNNIDKTLFRELKEPILIDLVSQPDVRYSFREVEESYSRTMTTTLNILEFARVVDASKVLLASSVTVYGNSDNMPTEENDLKKPISNYALYKFLSEKMLEYYSYVYSINTVAMRFASVTGGKMSRGIVLDIMKKLRTNSKELEIWGSGKQQRNYTYISDLISAIHIFIDRNGKGFDVFNISSDDWIEINDLIHIVENKLNIFPVHKNIEVLGGKGDVEISRVSNKKLRSIGWKPALSTHEAIEKTVDDINEYIYNTIHKG
jgi:UDP-glucose 4-epimerase